VNLTDVDGRFSLMEMFVAVVLVVSVSVAICGGYKCYKSAKNAQAKDDNLSNKLINQVENNDIGAANTMNEIENNKVETGDEIVETVRKTTPGIVSTDVVGGLIDGGGYAKNNVKLNGSKRNAKITSQQGPSGTYGELNSKGIPKTEHVKGGNILPNGKIAKGYVRGKPKR